MSVSLDQIASQIIANLLISDPDLDTSVGTTTRKIIDAVSEQIAEAYIDNQVISYQYDIDAKSGADLDSFVMLFGMARLPAKRASGTVTFLRSSNLSQQVAIPLGTTVSTPDSTPIVVQTVSSALMDVGVSSVDVAAQAVTPGSVGNVGANALTVGTVAGVDSETNLSAFSGGTDQESDTQLRARWKSTVFRSLAGTQQMYQGIATDDPDCYQANVIGSTKTWKEQIQVTGSGPYSGTSTIQNAKYIFSTPVFVGTDIDAGAVFVQGVDYTLTINNGVFPATATITTIGTSIPANTILEVQFEYEPSSSRNDVANNITNRVDVWCGGTRATAATQTLLYRTGNAFTNTTSAPLWVGNFERTDGSAPAAGNLFIPLAFGPILTVPPTITIAGVTYGLADQFNNPMGSVVTVGSDSIYYGYQIVHQKAPFGYTPTSLFGLEWLNPSTNYSDSHTHAVTDGTVVTIDGASGYVFNSMITDINAQIQNWRLLGVDAQTHQAKQIQLLFNLAIVYTEGANVDATQAGIYAAVNSLISSITFDGSLQISDFLQTVHGVGGVDNVRFLHGSDFSAYSSGSPGLSPVGIQQVIGETYNSVPNTYTPHIGKSYVTAADGRPYDIIFDDFELPVLYGINIAQKSANTFGSL